MTGGLFGESFDPSGGFAEIFGLGTHAEPPVSVLLRILCLAEKPADHQAVKAAFRARVMQAHPDVNAYADPGLRTAAEAIAAGTPEVQELVWARNALLRMTPKPVTGDNLTGSDILTRHVPRLCTTCDGKRLNHYGRPYVIQRGVDCTACTHDAENASHRERRRYARADRPCASCGATFTPPRSDGRYCRPACRQAAYRARSGAA